MLHQLETVPNPSSTVFRVSYTTDTDVVASGRVYDVQGRLVRELFNGPRKAGAHALQWDGRDQAGTRVAAGSYTLVVTTDDETLTRKVVLLK